MKSTRNIAALAARRRYRQQADMTIVSDSKPSLNDGTLNRTYTSMQINAGEKRTERTESDSGLTESRLAQHDKRFASSMNLRHGGPPELEDSTSTLTTEPLHTDPRTEMAHSRALYRRTTKKPGLQRQAAVTPITSTSRPKKKSRNDAQAIYQQVCILSNVSKTCLILKELLLYVQQKFEI